MAAATVVNGKNNDVIVADTTTLPSTPLYSAALTDTILFISALTAAITLARDEPRYILPIPTSSTSLLPIHLTSLSSLPVGAFLLLATAAFIGIIRFSGITDSLPSIKYIINQAHVSVSYYTSFMLFACFALTLMFLPNEQSDDVINTANKSLSPLSRQSMIQPDLPHPSLIMTIIFALSFISISLNITKPLINTSMIVVLNTAQQLFVPLILAVSTICTVIRALVLIVYAGDNDDGKTLSGYLLLTAVSLSAVSASFAAAPLRRSPLFGLFGIDVFHIGTAIACINFVLAFRLLLSDKRA